VNAKQGRLEGQLPRAGAGLLTIGSERSELTEGKEVPSCVVRSG
jgi:hypothetical protein